MMNSTEIREKAAALEDAIFEIGEAIASLKGFDYETEIGWLDDVKARCMAELDSLEADIAAADAAEEAELNREYERGLL